MRQLKAGFAAALMIASGILNMSGTPRSVENINFDWQFKAGDEKDAYKPGYDDTGWQTVHLPHDFQISQPWVAPSADEKPDPNNPVANVASRLSSRGFKEMGTGWYRRILDAKPEWKNRRVLLDFGGIMLVGDVYFNGVHVGGTDYGHLGFEIDVTDLLNFDKPNIIAVRADTGNPDNCRWYTGGGLYRNVDVVVTDPDMYFTRHPLYITTPEVSAERSIVKITAEVAAEKYKGDKLTVNTVITDGDGKEVYANTTELPFSQKQRTNEYLVDSLVIENPRLWDLDSPHLYNVKMSLLGDNGDVIDTAEENFGVRKIEYSPEFGFKLNGKKVLFQGLSGHNTYGVVGSAAYPKAIERQIATLKKWGFNEIRCAHNPYSREMLELCDKYGMLVVDEIYDKWLTQYAGGRKDWMEQWPKDVPEWVKRDRNHPCVVMWSLGNELQTMWEIPFADWGVTPYRLQKTLLNRYDKTRPVTVAMHPRGRNLKTDSLPAPLALETDIAAYNFRYMYFPIDRRNYPNMIFFQSEANTAFMGPNFFDMDRNSVVGLSYWGMVDYIGESTGWPNKGWTQGVFDISLEPKPRAYFLRSYFKPDEPLVHIGVVDRKEDALTWNDVEISLEQLSDHWNRTPGNKYKLYTFTNGDEVELFVNGRSLGRRHNDTIDSKVRNRIIWEDVPYEAGNIEAVAYKFGSSKPIARHKVETSGKMSKIRVTGENDQWKADGMDLQYIRIEALDSKSRPVPGENTNLQFNLEGPAQIVGVINGDMSSNEPIVNDSRSLYNGRALIVLRSTRERGDVVLTVTPEKGAKPVRYKMTTL